MDKLRLPDARRVFASIYNNVLLTTDVTPIKSILVCSADAGEGATTVAVGLALAAAEQQTGPVLLIDGNFRQPGVLAAFGQKDLYGLGEIMAGKIEAGCAISATADAKFAGHGRRRGPAQLFPEARISETSRNSYKSCQPYMPW